MTEALTPGNARRRHGVEVAWWAFVAVNLAGILWVREWATVPFHFIWISLALVYGWRAWSGRATAVVLAVVIVTTGGALGVAVLSGDQAADELTEIPLMSAVFVAMVWFVRRARAAQREAALVSERNLMLLHREQRFLQDASHMLRTPLTVALGYAEVLQRGSTDAAVVADLQVVVDELYRLRRITDRLLTLSRTEQVDFLRVEAASAADLVAQVHRRWAGTATPVRLGRVEDGTVRVDRDRVTEALDELVANAAVHAGPPIELATWHADGGQVFSVADRGPGIPEEDTTTIFDRWSQAGTVGHHRGVGLGLAIVKAVAEAHHGSVTVSSGADGARFELRLPSAPAQPVAGSGMLTGRSKS